MGNLFGLGCNSKKVVNQVAKAIIFPPTINKKTINNKKITNSNNGPHNDNDNNEEVKETDKQDVCTCFIQ